LLAVPFALAGGVFALKVGDMPLSVSAVVGFIALLGQVSLLGLLLVSAIEGRRHAGSPLELAIVEGSVEKLRAVLMASLLALFGLLPMAISTGIGSETQRPFALVIVGRMLTTLIITLFVLPGIYYMPPAQQQATIELPIPIFGQRGARVRAAELQVGRAESQIRLTQNETKRHAALEFVRLLTAQEQLAARRTALSEVERIGGLVSGRLASGMASRYALARAEAELVLAGLGVQRAEAEVAEHAAALAALVEAPGWRPPAAGSLRALQGVADRPADADSALARNPTLRVARDEASVADARVDVARRERLPVPSIALGRTWTSGPFGSADFIGLSSEIPILDSKRALEDKALAAA